MKVLAAIILCFAILTDLPPFGAAAVAFDCREDTCALSVGSRLKAGDAITFGGMRLVMQADGDLVILDAAGKARWAASELPVQNVGGFTGPTNGMPCERCFADFQADGNLVLRRPDGTAYWATNTAGEFGAKFTLSEATLLSILTARGHPIWSAGAQPREASADRRAQVADAMERLWNGTAQFVPFANFPIATVTDSGRSFINGMDEGTQIVPTAGGWYLFSREYDFGDKPSPCKSAFSRIVVRKSVDRGRTWSDRVVVAEPNPGRGECALTDGSAFWDAEQETWEYLSQVLSVDRVWHITRFTRRGPDPMGAFTPDPGNPIVRNRTLWSRICGDRKSCPAGTYDEGTPEIVKKENGFFYVTFHGAYREDQKFHLGELSPFVVRGFRGVARTRDWRNWETSGGGLPDDAIWSAKDCAGWQVAWNAQTGCIGGGMASTLIAGGYTYMLIESADLSLGCTRGQHWAFGLVRARRFEPSGLWEQWPHNPILTNDNGAECSVTYARLFQDNGAVYMAYWTLGPTGFHDPRTMFHVSVLKDT